jgi:hypothetical protein
MAQIPISIEMTKNMYTDTKAVSQIPMQCHRSLFPR